MTLDYYNQNALRKYPFKDACSLLSDNGVRLPDGCFVDAQVTSHLPNYQRAYLKQLSSDGTTLTVVVAPVNFAGTSEYTSLTITKPVGELVLHDTLLFDDSSQATVKLVVGPELASTAAQSFSWSFSLGSAEFASSAVPLFQPTVTAVTMENINTSNNLPTTLTTFNASQALSIQMGTNMVIGAAGQIMRWSVEPGKGAGLFDACSQPQATSPLRKINGIGPDEFGNFKIQSDTCYNKSMGAGWLAFAHVCGGGCHEVDYKSLAYYLNRLRNASNTLSNYAVATKQNYDAAVSATVSKIEAAKQYRPPYLKMETSVVRGMKQDFVSSTLGIHLPNKEKIIGSLAVNLGSKMTAIPQASSLSIDNVAVKQPDAPGFTSMHLNCKKNIHQKFATKATKLVEAGTSNLVDVWNKTNSDDGYYVDALLTHDRGVAFTYLPLFKQDSWFSINYNYFYKPVGNSGEYHVAFEIGFFDSENRQLRTAFTMELPNGLTIVQGSLKLWVDETVTAIDAGLQRAPGWALAADETAVTMDFSKKNRLTFKAVWKGDPCTDTPVNNSTITLSPKLSTNSDSENFLFVRDFQIAFTPPS